MYTLIREDYDNYSDAPFGNKLVLCVADDLYKIENYCTMNFKMSFYDLECLRKYNQADDVFDQYNCTCNLIIEIVEYLT